MPCYGRGTPVSGVTGSLSINGYFYPADSWEWNMESSSIELPTVPSVPWVDQQTGLKRLMFTATGTVQSGFNPFLPAGGNVYLNKYHTVFVYLNDTLYATCNKILITRWDYKDEADGTARYITMGVGSWRFSNFGPNFN